MSDRLPGALRAYLLNQGDPVDGVELRAMVPVNLRDEIVLNVGAGEIEDHLIAHLRAGAVGEVNHPIGMRTIKVAVRIDHFWLEPEAEFHPKEVHLVDQRP